MEDADSSQNKGAKSFRIDLSGLKYVVGAIKVIGIPGFVVACIIFVFLRYGTLEQKRAFIDRFILLDKGNESIEVCVLVIIALIAILLIVSFYCKRTQHLMKVENNRIGEEKTKWETLVLEKVLHSSRDND